MEPMVLRKAMRRKDEQQSLKHRRQRETIIQQLRTILKRKKLFKYSNDCSVRTFCTYFHFASNTSGANEDGLAGAEQQQLLYSEIERLMKAFKVHRCALDFDRGFVNAELKQCPSNSST